MIHVGYAVDVPKMPCAAYMTVLLSNGIVRSNHDTTVTGRSCGKLPGLDSLLMHSA